MKALSIVALAALALAGCTEEERQRGNLRDSSGYPLEVLVDRATGCQYLTAWQRGVTPRLNRDGRHICSIKEPA